MEFPIYRKYPNNKSYFKVLDEQTFEELRIMGSHYNLSLHEAKILPDRNYIADMIGLEGGFWVAIEAWEYEKALKACREIGGKMP